MIRNNRRIKKLKNHPDQDHSNQEEDRNHIEDEDRMFTLLQSKKHTQEMKKVKNNPQRTIIATEVEVEEVEFIEVEEKEVEVIEVEEEKEVEGGLLIVIIRKQKRKEIGDETIKENQKKSIIINGAMKVMKDEEEDLEVDSEVEEEKGGI